ncbi:MAG: S49 family peptidase [Spirochaetes bacterium]|nr:S49 family peptidase [Spirochaetota bacterium]
MAAARELFPNIAGPGSPEAIDKIYSRDGDAAVIRVEGPLSIEGPDAWDMAYGYGGVSYQTIIGAFIRAADDQGVARVRVEANTPGGTVDGADATYLAARDLESKKAIDTVVSGMLASAGYYALCPSSEIYASNPTNTVGSIGVIVAAWDFSGAYEGMGIKRVEIRSKNAPKKAANPGTKTGRDVLQERVDAIERVFYSRISEARGVTPDEIAERFGQGALLIAQDPSPDVPDALRAGMIDGILEGAGLGRTGRRAHASESNNAEPLAQANNPASAGSQQEVPSMNLNEFLAQGPAAVAEIDRLKSDARAEGKSTAEAAALVKQTRIAAVMGSEAYAKDAIIATKAAACLKGDISLDAFETVVATADMIGERLKSRAAAGETGDQGETHGQAPAGEAAEIASAAALIASGGKLQEVK